MTLEQQAKLLGRIERRMVEKHGWFHTKVVGERGVRYFASLHDACHMREAYAGWLVRALQTRENRRRKAQVLAVGYYVTSG